MTNTNYKTGKAQDLSTLMYFELHGVLLSLFFSEREFYYRYTNQSKISEKYYDKNETSGLNNYNKTLTKMLTRSSNLLTIVITLPKIIGITLLRYTQI